MNRELSDKCYIQLGKVVIVTTDGEEYVYCDGELTPLSTADNQEECAGPECGRTATV